MKVTADTTVLVRTVVGDDPVQTRVASKILDDAQLVALPLPSLCELAWVLRSTYRLPSEKIASAIGNIISRPNTAVDLASVKMGLSALAAGGDFVDGVIAAAGSALGGQVFVSFDQKAVNGLNVLGVASTDAHDIA